MKGKEISFEYTEVLFHINIQIIHESKRLCVISALCYFVLKDQGFNKMNFSTYKKFCF